jgi:hypothetical protein
MRKKYVVSSEKLVKKLTGRKRLNYENELNKIGGMCGYGSQVQLYLS